MSVARPSAPAMLALRRGAAWAPLELELVDLSGADRVRFLHNLVTCEVRGITAGSSVRGYVTLVKGGVLAPVEIEVLDDRFRLVLPAGRGAAVARHLTKYRIIERVEIAPRDELASGALRGAGAPDLLHGLGVALLEAGEHRVASLGGVEARVRREARGREPRFVFEAPAPALGELGAALLAAGATAVGPEALEAARIEDGELAWGIDYGEENFPQEAGDEAAVSWTKGCYLGQEIVARIHYRGGVQRQARRLRLAGGPEPVRGAELTFEERTAGRLTSLAVDPVIGATIGLALIHRRAATPGTRLATSTGSILEVEAAESA